MKRFIVLALGAGISFALVSMASPVSAVLAQETPVAPNAVSNPEDVILAGPNELPLSMIVNLVSDCLGYKFMLSKNTKDMIDKTSVTIIVPGVQKDPVTGKDSGGLALKTPMLFGLLQAMLKQNAMVLTPFGEDSPTSLQFYEIVGMQDAVSSQTEVIWLNSVDEIANITATKSSFLTLVAPLNFADVITVRSGIQPFMTNTGGIVSPVPGVNALLIADFPHQIRRVAKILQLLDKPPATPRFETININYMDAEEMAGAIGDLMQAQKTVTQAGQAQGQKPPSASDIAVEITVAPNINALMIQGYDKGIAIVRDLVSRLDVKIPGMDVSLGRLHHYKVRNTLASKLEGTLNALIGSGVIQGIDPNAPPVVTPPNNQANNDANQPLIVANDDTNHLLIIARPADFNELMKIIQTIDVRKPQVMIEAAFVEVQENNDFQFGAEVATIDGAGDGVRVSAGTVFGLSSIVDSDGLPVTGAAGGIPAGRLPIFGKGFTAALTQGGSFRIPLLLSFLKTQARSNVLSVPKVLAIDNEPSSIDISSKVPVVNTITTPNVGTQSNTEYVQDGITLEVTPTISEDNHIVLDISFVVEAFSAAVTNGQAPPTVKRTIKNIVTVPNGETVVIGGLTSTGTSRTVNKVPFLGDIPLLGELFKAEQVSSRRTNLYMFIRPEIQKERDFSDIISASAKDLNAVASQVDWDPNSLKLIKSVGADQNKRTFVRPGFAPRHMGIERLPEGK